MKPVKFKEANTKMGAGQPQYIPLACAVVENTTNDTDWMQYHVKYELNDLELAMIIKTRSFYFEQNGYAFNPMNARIENPLTDRMMVAYIKSDKGFECWCPLVNGDHEFITATDAPALITKILDRFPELETENLYFYEKPTAGIDESGNLVDI